MEYPCDVCDKTINIKSKIKHLQSITHKELDKYANKAYYGKSRFLFKKDEVFKNYITNHNKKIDSFIVKNDFDLVFNKAFYPHTEFKLRNIQAMLQLYFFFTLDWV